MPGVGVLELLSVLAIAALYLGIPIALLVLIWRRVRMSRTAAIADRDPALLALRSRLAAGEIDEVEYRRLRSALNGG